MTVTQPTISNKTRWTLGALALSTSMVAHAALGIAGTATLIMSDTCDNPVSSFNYQWTVDKHGSSALFYMHKNGDVSELTSTGKTFGAIEFDTVYVVAHGNLTGTEVGGISNGTFATKLKSAYTGTPTELFFATCYSAKASSGSGSLLKQVSNTFGNNIDKLSGTKGCASLTYNDLPVLQKAIFKDAVTRSKQSVFDDIVNHITNMWDGTDKNSTKFPSETHSYKKECEERTTANFNKGKILNFIAEVNSNFASSPPNNQPKDTSTNYFDLIILNDSSSPMTECGKNPTGNGTIACP